MKTCLKFFLVIIPLFAVKMEGQELSKREVQTVLEKIPGLISEHYVLQDKNEQIINAIKSRAASGEYGSIHSPDSLAKKLTLDLRSISNDKHLYVKYYESENTEETFDWKAWEKQERISERIQNFGFTEIKILHGNIGYLKIVEFMHPKRAMPTAVAAMKFLENTEGLIIDLRGNGGGYGGIMNYIMNHYFDGGPTHISTTYYSDDDEPPNKEYTSDLVYGKLRINTPLYIITDHKTGSAAEFFCYTLQSFEKAKIIGQPSAGAAHLNSFYPLSENLRISISTAAPINPKTLTNWENTGVIPDVVGQGDEIEEALLLILKETSKK